MPGSGNGNPEALSFWEPRDSDGEPEVLVFGTGERIAVTDRVFQGESGALLLKWKREADAAVREAAREMERLDAEAKRLEEAPAARPAGRGLGGWSDDSGAQGAMTVLKPKRKIYVRRLAVAETWAAQAVITKRLDTLAANRLDALAAERARPWWRRLAG